VYATLVTVEVGVRDFRERLRYWLERAAGGDEVIVTERGRPRARVTGVAHRTTLDRLVEQGLVTPPTKPKRQRRGWKPVHARGSVTDLLLEDRRAGY
jgi:prevent-host-death family protein